ncbi:PD-(D/E)XK nuclease family protein [Haloarcula sp. CGMCC 1.2071]|uniref:PD-(D/E)XK nuclease family protein n=1 Tax=Haloarcula sp. CGMCC 1.2071 TaxID=3111454 RepID=UPI00300ED367
MVGDIDRLLVTLDRYQIINYKTNGFSTTLTAELPDHYRPQKPAYALALLQHDPDRKLCASLRSTDAAVEENFDWDTSEYPETESELATMIELVTES